MAQPNWRILPSDEEDSVKGSGVDYKQRQRFLGVDSGCGLVDGSGLVWYISSGCGWMSETKMDDVVGLDWVDLLT